MFNVDDAACDVAPVTLKLVAAVTLDAPVMASPSAVGFTPRPVPFKLTLLAVELTVEAFK